MAQNRGIMAKPSTSRQQPRQQAKQQAKKKAKQSLGSGIFANPTRAIQAQFKFSNPNQQNPFGSQSVGVDENGNPYVNSQLSQNQQRLLDQDEQRNAQLGDWANQQYGQAQQAYGQPFNLSGVGGFDPTNFNFDQQRSQIEDATYNRLTRGMEDQFKQESQDFEQQMANRGIQPGNALYTQLQSQMGQRQNEARLQAKSQATQQGGEEFARQFGVGLQARQQGVGEYLMGRDRPFEEYTNVLGARQGPTLPNFQAYQAPDISGMYAQQGDWANKLQLARIGAASGGGGGLGYDPFALNNQKYEHDLALMREEAKLKQGMAGSPWANAAGGIGAGFASGLGSGIGKYIEKLF